MYSNKLEIKVHSNIQVIIIMLIMIYTICGVASLPTSTTTLVKYATNAEEETGNEAVTVSTQMPAFKLSSTAADTHYHRLGYYIV